jgi:hypothetical protein
MIDTRSSVSLVAVPMEKCTKQSAEMDRQVNSLSKSNYKAPKKMKTSLMINLDSSPIKRVRHNTLVFLNRQSVKCLYAANYLT